METVTVSGTGTGFLPEFEARWVVDENCRMHCPGSRRGSSIVPRRQQQRLGRAVAVEKLNCLVSRCWEILNCYECVERHLNGMGT